MTVKHAGDVPQSQRSGMPVWLKILIGQIVVALVVLAFAWMCEPDFLFHHDPVFRQEYSNGTSRVSVTVDYAALNNSDPALKNAAGEIDLANYAPIMTPVKSNETLARIVETVGVDRIPFATELDKLALSDAITWSRSDETTATERSRRVTGEDGKRRIEYYTEYYHLTVNADVSYSTDDALNNDIAAAAAEIYYQTVADQYRAHMANTRGVDEQAIEAFREKKGESIVGPAVTVEPKRTAPNTILILILVFAVAETIAMLFALKPMDWKTRVSFFLMGFGCLSRGQILRGLLFLLFEVIFILYMVLFGFGWIEMLPSLGKVGPTREFVQDQFGTMSQQVVYHDNSFRILLYGVLTIFFIAGFVYTYVQNIRMSMKAEQIIRTGKKLKSGKDDLRSLVDDQFHKTLLALPLTGILIFTVLPIIFMILVAFTNYDGTHNGYTNNLFHWVGLDNFNTMLNWSTTTGGSTQSYAATFGEVLVWTLIWAFLATFTNYFLGMFVAMMINKKGITLKKAWRTILVLTIAIPQFISLLYVSKMFSKNGIINGTLMDLGLIEKALPFWEDPWWSRFTVIFINIWIGIPYLMLITTGILMNIPADLYESARIDGANAWQQYTKITLPYMLFVTGPYLLTSFTGNMNNFNVIYLLTGGAPTNPAASGAAGAVGYSDLLITWLFKITTGAESQYYLASVVGILVFVVVAIITLVVYNLLPSIKNEEDFQ